MDRITDRIAPKGPDENLEKQVRQDLSFLFTDFGARVVSNRHLPGIGNSELIVEAQSLRFRVDQGCGTIEVTIAPSHAPEDWNRLTPILKSGLTEADYTSSSGFSSLAEQGASLRKEFRRIEESFTEDRYATTVLKPGQRGKNELFLRAPGSPRPSLPILSLRIVIWLVRLLFLPIVALYGLIFRPKKNRWEPIGSDEVFVNKVLEDLLYLFTDHRAKIFSSGIYSSFGNACVAVDTGNLRLRAQRDRGCVSYEFAALLAPWLWYPVEYGVMALQMRNDAVPSKPSLWSIRQLPEYFNELSEACNKQKFPQTKRNLELIREASQKERLANVGRHPQDPLLQAPSNSLRQRS